MNSELIWAAGLLAGVVVEAALVNRFFPAHRRRLRRVVILFVIYAIVLGGAFALEAAHVEKWSDAAFIAAELLQAYTIINIVGTLGFSLVLPAAGVELPMIASDLIVGLGYIAATLGILSTHGLNPTGALVSGAVVSAVLAISLQSTLGNILGGVALQLDGSIHEGDWIQLENGKQGKVRAVRWRHTVVETRDWSTIIVPNAALLQSNIMILGKREGRTTPQRMWVWFNVDFRYPPTKVIETVTQAILGSPIENVADDPKPNVVCMDFTMQGRESFATYAVRYWILDLTADDPTNSRVRSRVFAALRRAQIPLAIPAVTNLLESQTEERDAKRAARHMAQRLAALRTVHLFQSFTEPELVTLTGGMSHVVYTVGETITRQGAVAHWLYVMISGRAEARVHREDGATAQDRVKTVATLTAPDFFGEMGLMTGEPRANDVVAVTDVECFRLGKEAFEKVLLGRPAIANELSEKLATRRMELVAVRDGLDDADRISRVAGERERILGAIKQFFGL